MPHRLKTIFFFLSVCFYILLSSPFPVYAQTKYWTRGKCFFKDYDIDGVTTEIATLQGFECLFKNILRVAFPLAVIAAFIALIIGGFQYLTSGGEPKQAQKAQSIITTAIIGLLVIFGVWFIFQFLNQITGLDLLKFEVPGSP